MKKSIKNNIYLLKQLNCFSKSRVWVSLLSAIFSTINDMLANIIFVPYIFSAVQNKYSINKVVFACALMMVTVIIIELFNVWKDNVYIPKSNLKIERGFQLQLYNKAEKIDLICYDDPEFYNNSVWVVNDINKRAIAVLDSVFGFISNLLMIGSVIGVVIYFEPVVLIMTVIPTIIAFVLSNKINKVNYEFDKEKILPDRKYNYINNMYASVSTAKELRIFGSLFKPFEAIFNKAMQLKKANIKKYGNKLMFYNTVQEILIFLIGNIATLIYLVYKSSVTNSIDTGIMVALLNGVMQISYRLTFFTTYIQEINKHSMYIENYKSFINMKREIKENEEGLKPKNKPNEIKIENVSFKYKNSNKYVLKNININIKDGEKVAIVGHNGAGKTTLIKLIMRLYLPSKGTIYLDGIKEERYNLSAFRKRFGVIFQDFQLYAMSIAENVLMNEYSEHNKSKVDEALLDSGLYDRVYAESNNIKTNVTKEYDENGVIFSGGQAQKLAVSRVFAKNCGIIIMDEPSSALDPISEYEMHKNMIKASKNKTVILISHRLSTTKDADKIYYLENGEVVEQGSHDELMKIGGKYSKMFHLQADKYAS